MPSVATPDMERARELYLLHLSNKISQDEAQELQSYFSYQECRRLFTDLSDVYNDADFKQLLRVRPTSARFNELAQAVLERMQREEAKSLREHRLIERIGIALLLTLLVAFTFFRL